MSAAENLLCPFHCKPRPSRVILESLGLENIPQGPEYRPEVGQNHDARTPVSATLSRKWCGTIFRPISSKVCIQKLVLCEFHCKPWPSGVSLESPRLENIPQVPGKRAELEQNHDARNVVSAIVSVLKWSVAIFRPTSSKVSVQKVLLCSFECKPRPSGVSLDSWWQWFAVKFTQHKFLNAHFRASGPKYSPTSL